MFKEFVERGVLLHIVDYGGADEVEEKAKKAMEELKKYEKMLSFPVEKEVHSGVASKEILMTAPVNGTTLIITGKRGKSIIRELLLGSTAESVIRSSILPVLVVQCDIF